MARGSPASSGPAGAASTIAMASVGRAVLRGRGFMSLFIGVVIGGDFAISLGF